MLLPPISSVITLVGLVLAFFLFLIMAIREISRAGARAIYNLKFQLAIATFVWLIGESLSVVYVIAYNSYNEFLEIHTISMWIFATIILMRLPNLVKRSQ